MASNSKVDDIQLTAPGAHSFDAPGVTLSYTVKGKGPILFVQAAGWGTGSRYLQIGLAPLEASFTLIFLEPRGSSPSGRPEDETNMSNAHMADDIDQFRLHLGLFKIDLLGHSNGGSIALGYAQRFPNAVNKLILVTHSLDTFDDSETWKRFLEDRRDNPLYQKSLARLQPKSAEEAVKSSKSTSDEEEYHAYLDDLMEFYIADPPKHLATWLEAMGKPSLWTRNAQSAANKTNRMPQVQDLPRVKAKTLCIAGKEDPVCSVRTSQATCDGIKGAECVILDSGHFPWIEVPERFFPLVINFMLE